MSIIDEIRSARMETIPEEYKNEILANIKAQLIEGHRGDYALIDGAKHYPNQGWKFPGEFERRQWPNHTCAIRAPFRFHAAIAEWLHSLGFICCRHYNKGGVDNGMEVRLS